MVSAHADMNTGIAAKDVPAALELSDESTTKSYSAV